MKIGIDARMMGEGFGIGRYTLELVGQLIEIGGDDDFVIFLRRDNWDILVYPDNWKKVLADVSWYSLMEQLRMPSIIHRESVDIMHYPHWNVPLLSTAPFVLTVHDLIMYHFPRAEASTLGLLKFWLKDRLHRLVLHISAWRARHIITTSEFTKCDIVRYLHVAKEKITVIYQAPYVMVESANDIDIKKKYGIAGKYILYVGSAYPHKNIEGLLEAWRLIEDNRRDITLVLVGSDSYFYDRIRSSSIFKELERVIHTGFVDDTTLDTLYREAQMLVHPSFYEGFGLTPLEALSRGTPVAVASASSLPEIVGECGLYFDPHSPSSIAEAIDRLLVDMDLRRELLTHTKRELSRFSWRYLADRTLGIYHGSLR
jgi:glycosyltransferase involved in cell wall biosynthesis